MSASKSNNPVKSSIEARKKRREMHGIAGQLSAAGYLPPLPLPAPEIGFEEDIHFGNLASVKKALKRRGLSLNSIGLRGKDRLNHLVKRLRISLIREEEALDEAALCKELKNRGESVVTVGILGRERTKMLAQRLYECRQKELIRVQAKEKLDIWKNIAGANPEERKKTFQDYNRKKYEKLLSAAIAINNYPEVQRLMELGCDPNFETKGGHTALNQAATFNKIELTKWLVKKGGADVNFQSSTGRNPIVIASLLGYTEMIHVLVELGADVNFETHDRTTPLIGAAREGRESSTLVLIQEGANIDRQNVDGTTALMVAAESKQLHVLRLLLQHDADPDLLDIDGRDALVISQLAHAHDSSQMLADYLGISLIPKGSNSRPNSRSNNTKDRRRSSIKRRRKKSLASEDDNNEETKQKKKGLSVKKVMQNAIIGNDFDAICRLIRRNLVNPHTETFSGETALMRASYYGRLKEMELLLAMGSEVDYQNGDGRSALMSAAKNNQSHAIELLIQWGAYIQLQDADGWTALMLAAENGGAKAVKKLLEHGAFVNHRNGYGKTAFVAAIGSGQGETASLLMPRDAAMRMLEGTIANLAQRGILGMDDGSGKNADVQELIDKGIPSDTPLQPEDGGDDDDNMKIDPVTKGIKKVRNQNVTELVQEIADDVDEKVIERLQQQAIERGNIEAARKRGRREAVTDIEHSPLKNVPFVTAKHIDPKTFTFSIDVCESVLDGMRERLDGVKARMKKLVEEGGKVPDKKFEYFSDPAELRLAAFYISVDEPYSAAKMLKKALQMQQARFGGDHFEIARSLNIWGGLYSAMGKFDKAVLLHEKARSILIRNHGSMHEDVATTFRLLIEALIENKEFERGIQLCSGHLNVLRKKLNRHDPLCKDVNKLARLVEKKMKEYNKEELELKEKKIRDAEQRRLKEMRLKEKERKWREKQSHMTVHEALKTGLSPETMELLKMESFQKLLAEDPLFQRIFKKYSRYAWFKMELTFYLEVERFKRMSSKKEEFGVLAMSIFKRYILTAFLPSLGQELRMRVKRRIKALHNVEELFDKRSLLQQVRKPKEIFDEAQAQILSFMHGGPYQDFFRSKYGRRYLIQRIAHREHTPGWIAFQSIVRRKLQQKKYIKKLKKGLTDEEKETSEALEEIFEEIMENKRERNDAAAKIQGMFRSMKARQAVRNMLKKVIVQRYDNSTRQYYYLNTKTGESSWEQPKMLQQRQKPRPQQGRRRQQRQQQQQQQWMATQDPESGRTYWYNGSGETTWENPY